MKILIIGGTGLISREITKQLLQRGDTVTLFNRGKRENSAFNGAHHIIGDRTNSEFFRSVFKNQHYDAAIDMICYNKKNAVETIAALENVTDHLVVCSSVAAYKRPCKSIPIKEDSEDLVTTDTFPYAFHKAEMERYFNHNSTSSIPVTLIRPSLTFGPGGSNIGILRQNYGIVDRIKKGKPLVLFGDGKTPINFTFTPDLAKGFIGVLGNKKAFNNTYHITSEFYNLWEDLYLEFGKILGIEPKLAFIPTDTLYRSDPTQFAHIHFEKQYPAVYDNSKIRESIPGFKAEIDLKNGLQMILDWYKESSTVVNDKLDTLEDNLIQQFRF